MQLESRVGMLFASFLPGTSIKLVQKFLLAQNLKLLNHKLICGVLEVLTHVITRVFDDRFLNETFAKETYELCTTHKETISANVKSLIIDRAVNKEWTQMSSQKLFVLIERLLEALMPTDNYNVQLSLVKFSASIVHKCYFTLNSYLELFLKVLVTFAASEDRIKEENHLAQTAIDALQLLDKKDLSNPGGFEFVAQNKSSVINKCVEDVLLKLTSQHDENTRVTNLKILYGYLKLVGTGSYLSNEINNNTIRLSEFFYLNMQNVNKLLQALISSVVFDYKSLSNFYQIENVLIEGAITEDLSSYTGLKTYLTNKREYELLALICDYLGRSNAARLLIDELLTNEWIYLQQTQNKCEVMYLVNLILKGFSRAQSKSDESYSIVNLILMSYLNDAKLDTNLITVEQLSIDESTTRSRNREILGTCLVLEMISTSSQCLGEHDFNSFLIDTLYFGLENYLNSNLLIRVVSSKCMSNLALNLGYASIQLLLSSNYDYIMNDLILKSHNNAHDDGASISSHVFVLCALLDIANADLVPYLERLIDDYALLVELNSHDLNRLEGICRIMLQMSKSMHKWYPVALNFIEEERTDKMFNIDLRSYAASKRKPEYTKSFAQVLSECDQQRISFELNTQQMDADLKKNVADIVEENEEELLKNMESQLEQEQASKKTIPLHVKLQSKCMELCVHLVSHPFKQIRLDVIDLIAQLSRNLAEHTDEFLPLVNNIWMPICQRFSLDDLVVKAKIIYLIFNLAVCCADFLSSRFCKEFLPRLCAFMNEQARLSLKTSGADTTYVYSHAFKLQCAVLENIDQMCVLFDIKEMELEHIIETSVFVYLDKRQPKKLQILALNFLRNCSLIDADLVWLVLHYIMPFASLNARNTDKLVYSNAIKHKCELQMSEETLVCLKELFESLTCWIG